MCPSGPTNLSAVAGRSLEGRRLGRYRLRHKLAEGGMANIYLAQLQGEQAFERWVAIKVVHPESAEDPAFATMLGDEARIIARLHHPNVCSVIDFGRDGDHLFLVMEYLHGESLAAVVRRAWAEQGSLPAWLVARTLTDAARGLHAAHELTDRNDDPLELVHRDVSPGNIVVSYDGLSKVIDFGVVRARGRQTKTAAGVVKGKLSHMAPEQLTGQGVDRRADVWSMGVVLWEATLGRRLFRGTSQGETVERVVHAPIPRPSEVTDNYPPELEQIVMAALSRDLDRRTPTARVFATQLEGYLYGLGRPSGHAEVAAWMREVFSDRLLVRDALLDAPEDSGPHATDELRDESTASNLIGGRIATRSFAPPPLEQPTGITVVASPTAIKEREASQRVELERDIDRTLANLKRQKKSRGTTIGVLAALALLLAAAVIYVVTQGAT